MVCRMPSKIGTVQLLALVLACFSNNSPYYATAFVPSSRYAAVVRESRGLEFSNTAGSPPGEKQKQPMKNATTLAMANSPVVGKDRILSCLPYLLPILDGDSYGRYIFRAFPPLGLADAILLGPFHLIYDSIPFFGLIAFFGLTFASRNPDIPRSIRFNMQQAVLMDIILIFPSLFGRFGSIGGIGGGMPRILVESGNNFVFYVLVAAVGYALFSNVTGKVPNQIPWVSEAAEQQIGPF